LEQKSRSDKKKINGSPVNISKVYGFCVGRIGIDPVYFLDEMSQDEMIAIIETMDEYDDIINRRTWEQTRTICYYNYVTFKGSKEIDKPSKLFKFEWEKHSKTNK